MRTKFFKRKMHSKKGYTLVELVCAIAVFAIVCAGILNAVAFSREMVYTNNSRDKASDKAQFVADELVAAATGVDPSAADGAALIQGKMDSIAADNDAMVQNGLANEADKIGAVTLITEEDFIEPTPENNAPLIQYILKAIPADEDADILEDVGGITQAVDGRDIKQAGWDIRIRVYYKQVGGGGSYRSVDVSAFAPQSYVS